MSQTQPNKTAVAVNSERSVEYIPFGAQDTVKLSIDIIRNLIAVPSRSGATPSDRDCIKFIAMCKSRRLNPFEGDAFLLGWDTKNGPQFNLVTAHQALLKRAEVHPKYDGMKSGVIIRDLDGVIRDIEGDFHLDEQELLGGWAIVYLKDQKVPSSDRVKLSRYNTGFGLWEKDPAGMVCKVAEASALRKAFPTTCGGLYLREEVSLFAAADVPTPAGMLEAPAPASATTITTETAKKPDPGLTDAQRLEKIITDAGFTWDQFKTWAVNENQFQEANDYSEIAASELARLLRAPRLLIQKLREVFPTQEKGK